MNLERLRIRQLSLAPWYISRREGIRSDVMGFSKSGGSFQFLGGYRNATRPRNTDCVSTWYHSQRKQGLLTTFENQPEDAIENRLGNLICRPRSRFDDFAKVSPWMVIQHHQG